MKKIIVMALLVMTCLPLMMVESASAQSGSKYKNAKSLVKKIKRTQNKLARVIARLNAEQVRSLNSEFSANTDDSDGDGVPDILEDAHGSDDCDVDSDDDGLDDGDEVENETDPDDSEDSLEVHAFIDSHNESSVTLGGHTFLVVESSEFLDDENNPVSYPAGFSDGDCAEAEGYYVGDVLTLDKLKHDDDCV